MSSISTQLAQIQKHPNFRQSVFNEFHQLARNFSDADFLAHVRPTIHSPSLADQVLRNANFEKMANNAYLQSHQPTFLIEIRLRLFASSIEGHLKFLFDILRKYLVQVHRLTEPNKHTLGATFRFIFGNQILFPTDTQAYLAQFKDIVNLRNAISHNSYLIDIKTNKLTPAQLLHKVSKMPMSSGTAAILSSMSKLGQSQLSQLLQFSEKVGKWIGFTPEVSIFDEVDNAQSVVIFQDYPPGSWRPIDKNSPRISLSELTKSLNSFDQFAYSASFGLLQNLDDRFQNGNYFEKQCTACCHHQTLLASTTNFDCWYCLTRN